MSPKLRVLAVSLVLCTAPLLAIAQDAPDWDDVGALFADRCTMCHSGFDAPLALELDTLEHALSGSVNGPVLVPGDPDASELVRRIRGESEPRMPFRRDPLSPEQIALVEEWIRAGLPVSGQAAEQSAGATPAPTQTEPALPGPGEPITFAHVQPIFGRRCIMCHSAEAPEGPPEGLQLDSYANVLAGGERIVVLPGHADRSELVRRIEGKSLPRMPFNGPPWLSADEILLIRQWIEQGAADTDGDTAPIPVGGEIRFRGILTDKWAMDGAEFQVDENTRIDDSPVVGGRAEVRGVIEDDGVIRATRLRER